MLHTASTIITTPQVAIFPPSLGALALSSKSGFFDQSLGKFIARTSL